ncbi:hypothetical protein Hanom_Chr15g01398751 [Helianthus anomalus]
MAQSGRFAVPVQPNQTHPSYAFEQKADAGSVLQAGANPYGANVYQPLRPENPGMQLPEQMQQQLQSALYAAGQPPSDFDADKNERYQSTLQFAMNLLSPNTSAAAVRAREWKWFSSLSKERRANHRDTGRCGQGRLLDRRQPLGSPRCAENPTSTCPKLRRWNNR